MKNIEWLNNFAETRAFQQRNKTATIKEAEQVIVNPEDVPGAVDGNTVQYNGEQFKVINSHFRDDIGAGVVLEKLAGLEQVIEPPVGDVQEPAQTYAWTKLPIQQTFNNEDDAAWASTSAQGTAQEIATEDSRDRTTPQGFYQHSTGVNQVPVPNPNNNMYSFGNPANGVGIPTAPLQVQPGVAPANVDLSSFGNPMGYSQPTVGYPPQYNVGNWNPAAPGPAAAPLAAPPNVMPTDAPVFGLPATSNQEAIDPNFENDEEDVNDETMGLGNDTPSDYKDEEEVEVEENRVEARLKRSYQKTATQTKSAKVQLNAKILATANQVTMAIVDECEDVLKDAEDTVKKYIPAKYIGKVLTAMEKELEDEGIEVVFDKKVSRAAIRRTASQELKSKELEDAVADLVKAVVDEIEDVLKDADESMDEERGSMGADAHEVESKLKGMVERKLHAKGIYSRFDRTAKKSTVAQSVRQASRKRK